MQTARLKIIPVQKQEVNLLQEICVKTFTETYGHLNTPDNFKKYIEANFNIDVLTKEIDNPQSFTYFISLFDVIIGYLKLNTGEAQTEKMGADALEIERIYILKTHQGFKAGHALLNTAILKGKELMKKFIWLGVWEKNHKVIEFYERHGLKKFDEHVFILGDDEQIDFLYKLEI
ncbi:MAG: Prolyl aminopeptidase [Bacteroidetes bacterium]|nr:Prolyl aminopeptidase [Bacteroidota bacterium]